MPDQPSIFSFSGFFKLTRVWNLLIILLTQLFTTVFLFGKDWSQMVGDLRFILLLLTTVAIAAGGYVINDYYDVKIDYINKPERVVVGRTLKRRSVMAFHLLLSGFGVLGGLLIGWKVLAINLFSVGLLWVYSNQLKRMPFIGNLGISLLTAIAVFVIGVYYNTYPVSVIVYSVFAFFFTLVREIVKDIQDVKGDEVFGARTLPIVWGIRRTKQFIYLLMSIFTVSLFLFLDNELGRYWDYFLGGLVVAQLFLAYFIYRADTVKQSGLASQMCKLVMLVGILSMIVMG